MDLDIRPRVEEFWKRIGFVFLPARNTMPNRYTGHLTLHGLRFLVIVEEHLNGTTSTWIFNPPAKLRHHECFNEKAGPWPGKGWYFVHYQRGCPATFKEAVNALDLIVEDLLGTKKS